MREYRASSWFMSIARAKFWENWPKMMPRPRLMVDVKLHFRTRPPRHTYDISKKKKKKKRGKIFNSISYSTKPNGYLKWIEGGTLFLYNDRETPIRLISRMHSQSIKLLEPVRSVNVQYQKSWAELLPAAAGQQRWRDANAPSNSLPSLWFYIEFHFFFFFLKHRVCSRSRFVIPSGPHAPRPSVSNR